MDSKSILHAKRLIKECTRPMLSDAVDYPLDARKDGKVHAQGSDAHAQQQESGRRITGNFTTYADRIAVSVRPFDDLMGGTEGGRMQAIVHCHNLRIVPVHGEQELDEWAASANAGSGATPATTLSRIKNLSSCPMFIVSDSLLIRSQVKPAQPDRSVQDTL
jgi:hypothetical protein